jgi:hypothetical protein
MEYKLFWEICTLTITELSRPPIDHFWSFKAHSPCSHLITCIHTNMSCAWKPGCDPSANPPFGKPSRSRLWDFGQSMETKCFICKIYQVNYFIPLTLPGKCSSPMFYRKILVFKAILGISITKCTLKCFQDHNIGFQGQCKVWNPLIFCLVMKWCSTPIASKPNSAQRFMRCLGI